MHIPAIDNPLHGFNQFQLTFDSLRRANTARLPLFRDKQGSLAHSKPDGSDWSLPEWTNAIAGEVGEACNFAKKLRCGDYGEIGQEEYHAGCHLLLKELADVVVYSDITAFQLRASLGDAVFSKFNEVSSRVGANVYLIG